jgi:hypothetical protein
MKRLFRKKDKTVKGTSSALLLSILIHVVLFILAGTLVVFTVHKTKEVEFMPPKAVERPKIKLKKPKVKVNKASKPKSTARIMSKSTRVSMPSLDLPVMDGIGNSLGDGGAGGFDMLSGMGEMTVFGGGQTIGNDFVGTLYDFKRTREGNSFGIDPGTFLFELAKFTKTDWKKSRLSKYYQAPNKLYTTHFMIPTITSDFAPTAFGEPDMMGYAWMVHYEGQIVHPEGGTFRFWAQADDIIIVRLDGSIVVDGSVSDSGRFGSYRQILSGYENVTADSMKYFMGDRQAAVGEWFTLEPGVALPMEVVLGESPGGSFSSMLAIEEKGVKYPTSPQGGPLLPMFKTAEPTHAVLDSIYEYLIVGEACPTSGPVFSDYAGVVAKKREISAVQATKTVSEQEPDAEIIEDSGIKNRSWSIDGDDPYEAEFVCTIGDTIVLKNGGGKEIKVSRKLLSPEDIEYVDLISPPDLSIDFRTKSKQRMIATREAGVMGLPPIVLQWNFGARVKQISAGDYGQELNVEYFAIGQQIIDQNKYILLDRGQSSFTPSKENERSHEFLSDTMVELWKFDKNGQNQGREYSGGLVVVTDKQGNVVAHNTSKKWLWTHLDNLRQLPVGAFLDKSCARVYPSGPKATRY